MFSTALLDLNENCSLTENSTSNFNDYYLFYEHVIHTKVTLWSKTLDSFNNSKWNADSQVIHILLLAFRAIDMSLCSLQSTCIFLPTPNSAKLEYYA